MNGGNLRCGRVPPMRERAEDCGGGIPKEKRTILAEDAQQELNRKLRSLAAGDPICAEYYLVRRYVLFAGEFERVDTLRQCLVVSGKRIPLGDLRNVYREDWT